VDVADYVSALALVDAGMGVAMLPASLRALAPPGVMFRPLRAVRMISALWAVTRSHPSPHASELARRLAV
jgi:DNA-binding transcriptional LysR family regulator